MRSRGTKMIERKKPDEIPIEENNYSAFTQNLSIVKRNCAAFDIT